MCDITPTGGAFLHESSGRLNDCAERRNERAERRALVASRTTFRAIGAAARLRGYAVQPRVGFFIGVVVGWAIAASRSRRSASCGRRG